MFFISTLIRICFTVLIGHGVYFAMFKSNSLEKVVFKLSPNERLVMAYRLAYFTHICLAEEAREKVEGGRNDY